MRYIISVLILLVVVSCDNMSQKIRQEAIARVNDTYLYKDDIKNLVPSVMPKEDSISIVTNYITTWATKQLFIDQSKRNLTVEELQGFDNLVEDYKSTLYSNAYKNAVINKTINMEVTDQDIAEYYQENSENFNLNQELVKIRYLHLPTGYDNIAATKQEFNRFNDEDEEDLLGRKLEFITFSFADSNWVPFDQVLHKIPILKKENRKELLKDGKYLQLKDSVGLYMVKIKKVLTKNRVAPLEYIKPTIRQIILSKRKRELVKKLEKDITKDAIKNKQFEIYD